MTTHGVACQGIGGGARAGATRVGSFGDDVVARFADQGCRDGAPFSSGLRASRPGCPITPDEMADVRSNWATLRAKMAWAHEVSALANATLFPRTDSYQRIADVAAAGYDGFALEPAHRADDAKAS